MNDIEIQLSQHQKGKKREMNLPRPPKTLQYNSDPRIPEKIVSAQEDKNTTLSVSKSVFWPVFVTIIILIVALLTGLLLLNEKYSPKIIFKEISFPKFHHNAPDALAGDIVQVLPVRYGAVAVLHTDGTVEVAGSKELEQAVSSWENIVKLWGEMDHLVAQQKDGTYLSTRHDLTGWKDLEEIYVWCDQIVGKTANGTLVSKGFDQAGYDPALWKNVQKFYFDAGRAMAIRTDGTVLIEGGEQDVDHAQIHTWKNVRELYDFYHYICAVLEDGSVVSTGPDDTYGFRNVKKLVRETRVFGISEDGELLTGTGNLYVQGSYHLRQSENPGAPEIELSRYRNIYDVITCGAIILLKNDGTVDSINGWQSWDFSNWHNIKKIYTNGIDTVYGLKADGTVITATTDLSGKCTTTDFYRNWRAADLYVGDGGVICLTADGKVHGDGNYAQSVLAALNE